MHVQRAGKRVGLSLLAMLGRLIFQDHNNIRSKIPSNQKRIVSTLRRGQSAGLSGYPTSEGEYQLLICSPSISLKRQRKRELVACFVDLWREIVPLPKRKTTMTASGAAQGDVGMAVGRLPTATRLNLEYREAFRRRLSHGALLPARKSIVLEPAAARIN
jgi:hypothetical protein